MKMVWRPQIYPGIKFLREHFPVSWFGINHGLWFIGIQRWRPK